MPNIIIPEYDRLQQNTDTVNQEIAKNLLPGAHYVFITLTPGKEGKLFYRSNTPNKEILISILETMLKGIKA